MAKKCHGNGKGKGKKSMDYKVILPLLMNVIKDPAKLVGMIKWYEKHKSEVKVVFDLIGAAFKRDQAPVIPVITQGDIKVYGLQPRLYFCEKTSVATGELYSKAEFDAIISGASGMMVQDRMHLDVDPLDINGKPYPQGVFRAMNFRKPDGAPAIDWRWTVDGKMNWNSQDEEDHFNWESYDDADVGCTPVMRLEKQAGPGLKKVEVWPLVEAEFNGGQEIIGSKLSFWID